MEIEPGNHKALLFLNKNKTEQKHPDYKGFIENKETQDKIAEIAAWENKSQKTGDIYLSLIISNPRPKQQEGDDRYQKAVDQKKQQRQIVDDDIPF